MAGYRLYFTLHGGERGLLSGNFGRWNIIALRGVESA